MHQLQEELNVCGSRFGRDAKLQKKKENRKKENRKGVFVCICLYIPLVSACHILRFAALVTDVPHCITLKVGPAFSRSLPRAPLAWFSSYEPT